ncbi:MAG: acylphosphatase [candidate division WOR-3 bacterium]
MATTSKSRLHALVSGRVQGVFYRMFVLQEAQRLRLRGCVRNMADGRVEVIAEGERSGLEQLVERLKVGPRGAAVENVDVVWSDALHEFEDFSIEY